MKPIRLTTNFSLTAKKLTNKDGKPCMTVTIKNTGNGENYLSVLYVRAFDSAGDKTTLPCLAFHKYLCAGHSDSKIISLDPDVTKIEASLPESNHTHHKTVWHLLWEISAPKRSRQYVRAQPPVVAARNRNNRSPR